MKANRYKTLVINSLYQQKIFFKKIIDVYRQILIKKLDDFEK